MPFRLCRNSITGLPSTNPPPEGYRGWPQCQLGCRLPWPGRWPSCDPTVGVGPAIGIGRGARRTPPISGAAVQVGLAYFLGEIVTSLTEIAASICAFASCRSSRAASQRAPRRDEVRGVERRRASICAMPGSSGAQGDASSSTAPCCSTAPRRRRWALPTILAAPAGAVGGSEHDVGRRCGGRSRGTARRLRAARRGELGGAVAVKAGRDAAVGEHLDQRSMHDRRRGLATSRPAGWLAGRQSE